MERVDCKLHEERKAPNRETFTTFLISKYTSVFEICPPNPYPDPKYSSLIVATTSNTVLWFLASTVFASVS